MFPVKNAIFQKPGVKSTVAHTGGWGTFETNPI